MGQALEVPLQDSLLMDKELLIEDVILSDNLVCDYHESIEVETPSRQSRRGKPGSYLLLSLTSVSRTFMEHILLVPISRHLKAYHKVSHSIFLGTQ